MALKILKRIFGYDDWQDQSESTGSVFHDRTPAEHLDAFDFNKYNRAQRRGMSFVLYDEKAEKFVHRRTISEGYNKKVEGQVLGQWVDAVYEYNHCDLEHATVWKSLETVKLAGDWCWSVQPSWHLTYKLVFLDKEGNRDFI